MTEPDFEVIAERELVWLKNDTGQKKTIVVRIGRPYWTKEGPGAACPVAISGMLEPKVVIQGVDLLHALEMAVLFADSFLSDPKKRRIVWPSGEAYRSPIKKTLENWDSKQL